MRSAMVFSIVTILQLLFAGDIPKVNSTAISEDTNLIENNTSTGSKINSITRRPIFTRSRYSKRWWRPTEPASTNNYNWLITSVGTNSNKEREQLKPIYEVPFISPKEVTVTRSTHQPSLIDNAAILKPLIILSKAVEVVTTTSTEQPLHGVATAHDYDYYDETHKTGGSSNNFSNN